MIGEQEAEQEDAEGAADHSSEIPAAPEWPKGTVVEDGKAVIKLSKPVKRIDKDGQVIEEITELRLVEPRMHHLAAQDGAIGQVNASMRIIAAVSGVSIALVKQMAPKDFAAAQRALFPFVQPMMG